MNRKLQERMEGASREDLFPEFDRDAGWQQLNSRLRPARPVWRKWAIAAGVALLLTAGGAALMLHETPATPDVVLQQEAAKPTEMVTAPPEQQPTIAEAPAATTTTERQIPKPPATRDYATQPVGDYHRSKEFVCNSTPCPLEICIIQTIKCTDGHHRAVSTCSILEPDQARQVHFKAPEVAGPNCQVTVDEIRIKRVSTGETIVLTSESTPSTAQDLFNCLMGKDKCELMAGVFNNDCNNQERPHSLRIENNYGNLTFQ